jgi:hypothetical protein
MEDSKIWWYLILGAIYVISKFLKKKKPDNQPQQAGGGEGEYQQEEETSTQKAPSSIEQILKELSQQSESRKETKKASSVPKVDSIPERIPQPIETYSREARPLPSQMENIDVIKPLEEIDIASHKELERDKPEYGRSQSFNIKEEVNDIADDIRETFQDADGARKAFLYGEVFNRMY